MSEILSLTDCKDKVLTNGEWKDTDEYGFFHFTPTRVLTDKSLFVHCTFADLRINHLTSWGAPVPSTFQLFFADLMKLLIPPGRVLVLNIVDTLSEGYFYESDLINSFLMPNNLEYFYLQKVVNEREVPTLFFECPIDKLNIFESVAFPGTATDVDGFVLERRYIRSFPAWIDMGNTDLM